MYQTYRFLVSLLFCVSGLISNMAVASSSPILNFSDLISGPDTGLGDGLGSGVIVTVWGQHLGSSQGSSVIEYCDSARVCRTGHVYYWKNADGALPSGPADLYKSHRMQEIAFSIPDSAMGEGTIRVRVGADQTTLPFTVRRGRIIHVKTVGNDTNPGTFERPLLTVARADDGGFAQLGDTVSIHDVNTGTATTDRAIYNNSGLQNTYANQYAYVSYPGTRASVFGADGFHVYVSTGFVTSKLSVFSSNCDASGGACFNGSAAGIEPSNFGRVIGNKITDQPNGCANSQAGAITGGATGISGAKIYGNYIHDYSCPEASRFHHTTYFTVRAVYPGDVMDATVEAFEIGWNHLENNHAQNGLHVYDEDNMSGTGIACGDLNGDLRIHDNVVVDQAGAGIEYIITCGWSQDTYIYNNLLVRVGRKADVNCKFNCGFLGAGIKTGDNNNLGDIFVFNNTIYEWDSDDLGVDHSGVCFNLLGSGRRGSTIQINDNICYTSSGKAYFGLGLASSGVLSVTRGTSNLFYSATGSPAFPSWAKQNVTGNPLLTLIGSSISVGERSPIINQSSTTLQRDVYGYLRGKTSNIGAVQYFKPLPASPLDFRGTLRR